MSADVDVRAWLRDRGAETIEHPGGTLYTHLCRVRDRLAELGQEPAVQTAGLAHAVYGTDGFDVALLDRTDRDRLRDLVGADAEALVYLYGACDRKRSWPRLASTGTVHDRFTGEATTVRVDQLTPLVDLSIVNELDVVDHLPRVSDRHLAYLRGLFAAWAPAASPAVREEVARVLGPEASG
ncbi:DUF6817 domain-containing protein [Micromonospora sp. WMMD998]|uniref:DUF6817 domain-containing protein n=1 Tax=Micromonospora sp. WMMD998 TaxID=3016092 RepID=UPI00249BC925|nr:hypothetical protein [Micromonospora sp. WMMD998]WFE40272.1 hypothetical protein O7619_18230 [Micromonospora sp. WMMD998]